MTKRPCSSEVSGVRGRFNEDGLAPGANPETRLRPCPKGCW